MAGLSDVVAPSDEVHCLHTLRDVLSGEVEKLQEEDYVPPANLEDEQVGLQLLPTGESTVAQIERLSSELIAAVEAELGSLHLPSELEGKGFLSRRGEGRKEGPASPKNKTEYSVSPVSTKGFLLMTCPLFPPHPSSFSPPTKKFVGAGITI